MPIRCHTYICFLIQMFFYCIFSYYLNDFYIFYMLTHQEDMYNLHSSVQDILWSILHKFVEPVLMHWPGRKLREKALATAMRHIHYEDECTRYINLGAVPKVTRGI